MSHIPPLRAAAPGNCSLEQNIRVVSGARAVRVRDAPGAVIPEHSHDWPVLSLYVLGSHRKVHEFGETLIAGPSAILHPAGAAHANRVGAGGLEQLDIEFDPAWLGLECATSLQGGELCCWVGGPVAAASRALLAEWRADSSEDRLQGATRQFLQLAVGAVEVRTPAWIATLLSWLEEPFPEPTRDLAQRLGMSPAWLAQAYRAAMGEGIGETQQRLRVERGVLALHAGIPAAEAAALVGFCDQSHMIRAFRRLLDRTPAQVQAEALRH